jgi:hypothetical protein
MGLTIREEQHADQLGIKEVHRRAFGQDDLDGDRKDKLFVIEDRHVSPLFGYV